MANGVLCYYVTGHGYGHAIRTIGILKALPQSISVILKTTVPERLFQEGLPGRDIRIISDEYDCGCVQSDNLTVMPGETLARYRAISTKNEEWLNNEAAFLRSNSVQCVVSDIASFPLRAAREAGIPSVAVANFTWTDIYQDYARTAADERLLQEMRAEYAAATLALITPLSLPTAGDPFQHVKRVPLVARRGANVRASLCQALGLPFGTLFALPYLGVWGMELAWESLRNLKEWVFLTYDAVPNAPRNVVALDRHRWSYADIAASVDAVLAKPGYGTLTECIANSIPLIYVPRAGFKEQEALIAGMGRWGGGIPISEDDFVKGHWAAALGSSRRCTPDPNAFAVNGAEVIAESLSRFCHD
jgi:hypothetical protein